MARSEFSWGPRTALIGHTGFVGSNLASFRNFQYNFNSTNFREIEGQYFDTVVCAGVSATKWVANQDAAADWEKIRSLFDSLKNAKAKKLILISTVDVYDQPNGVTEADSPPENHPEAYGRNRYRLEKCIQDRFDDHLIVRLPGLFGPGLKKNIIYDLMNNNQVEKLDRNTSFQWYPISRIHDDIERLLQTDIRLINIAMEPVGTGIIADKFFPHYNIKNLSEKHRIYDMRTEHATVLGGQGSYHLRSADVINELEKYIKASNP